MMLKLGLLGTIVGFILMLAPISNIDAYDVSTLKTALSSMSGGMAIALFTTLAGLVGGILLRTQYYLLDEVTGDLKEDAKKEGRNYQPNVKDNQLLIQFELSF